MVCFFVGSGLVWVSPVPPVCFKSLVYVYYVYLCPLFFANFAMSSHDGHGVRLQKSATKKLKEKHARRQEKKLQKRRAKGLPDPCYYKKDAKGRVSGGKDLASTAYYPARFCSAVHNAWKAEQSGFTGDH